MDEELFENLPEPEDQDAERINPWRRPILLISWGILLTTVTLRFLCLDKLLPAVGIVLMYLGFRALRRENGGFKAAYWICATRLALQFAAGTLENMPFFNGGAAAALTVPALILQAAQVIALRLGLAGAFETAGAPRRLGGADLLIVFNILIILGAVADVGDMGVLGLVTAVAYIAVILAVARLPRALGDAGCALRNAPVRLSDRAAMAAALLVLAAVTVAGYLAGATASVPASRPFEPSGATEPELPAEVLEVLSPEDIELLSGAVEIQYSWLSDYTGEYSRMSRGTAVDICTVSAELPGYRLAVIHYVRYAAGAPRFGDSFACTQSWGLDTDGYIGGGVIYSRGGRTFRAPLAELGSEVSSSGNTYIVGSVHVPLDAGEARAYVIYTLREESRQVMNYNLFFDLSHRAFMTGRGGGSRVEHVTQFSSFGELPDMDGHFYVTS